MLVYQYFILISLCLSLAASGLARSSLGPVKLHQQILAIDSHVDINVKDFTKKRHLGMELQDEPVTIGQMRRGNLTGAFFVVYVGQGEMSKSGFSAAYDKAVAKFEAIHRMTQIYSPRRIQLVKSPEDIQKVDQAKKRIAMIGVENAYPLGTDLGRVDEFFELGASYISLTHNGHNQFADSNYPKSGQPSELHGGLSKLGLRLVEKLNRLGIMIDVSHASKKSTLQAIKASRAPVIASHSAVFALHPHTRNVDDETLLAIKANGGVVQVVAFRSYLKKLPQPKLKALNKLADDFGLPHGNIWEEGDTIFSALFKKGGKNVQAYFKKFHDIEQRLPHASVVDLVDHIDYVVKKIGVDHVGISSDFGGGGGVDGWTRAEETPNVTLELVKRQYTKAQIQKIWGANLIRVWSEVRKVAALASRRARLGASFFLGAEKLLFRKFKRRHAASYFEGVACKIT